MTRLSHRTEALSNSQDTVYGLICRDPTLVELELMAEAGARAIWIDGEHGFFSLAEAGKWCRTADALGMIPMVRVPEVQRAYVQSVLDAGCEIVVAPNVTSAAQVRELVRYSKYPPLGDRGVSSTTARTGYTLGADVETLLRDVNAATHVMVQIESDEGLASFDEIVKIEGVDMVTIGPLDWSVSLGLFGSRQSELREKIDGILTKALKAGKTTAMVVRDREEAEHYVALGVRILLVGADIGMKRQAFSEAIRRIAEPSSGA